MQSVNDGALERLRAGVKGNVNQTVLARMNRFAAKDSIVSPGRPRVSSPIRIAIITEMNRRKLSGYALWKLASEQCHTLSQAAVYEFLRGSRSLGLEYLDAILLALNLSISQSKR